MDIDELEAAVSAKWGPTQFDWCIGRTVNDDDEDAWFYFCGTGAKPGKWKHSGLGSTIREVMEAMLAAD